MEIVQTCKNSCKRNKKGIKCKDIKIIKLGKGNKKLKSIILSRFIVIVGKYVS